MKNYIRLKDLLQYLDEDTIQIRISGISTSWDDYEELNVASPFIKPFENWFVTELGAVEESDIRGNDGPVIRVSIMEAIGT